MIPTLQVNYKNKKLQKVFHVTVHQHSTEKTTEYKDKRLAVLALQPLSESHCSPSPGSCYTMGKQPRAVTWFLWLHWQWEMLCGRWQWQEGGEALLLHGLQLLLAPPAGLSYGSCSCSGWSIISSLPRWVLETCCHWAFHPGSAASARTKWEGLRVFGEGPVLQRPSCSDIRLTAQGVSATHSQNDLGIVCVAWNSTIFHNSLYLIPSCCDWGCRYLQKLWRIFILSKSSCLKKSSWNLRPKWSLIPTQFQSRFFCD